MKKLRFKILIVGVFLVGSLIFSFVVLTEEYGILPLFFKPLPTIPNVTAANYEYGHGSGSLLGFPPQTNFRFRWKENLSFKERISSMEQAIKLYDNFAKENGQKITVGNIREMTDVIDESLFYQVRPISCEEIFREGVGKFHWEDGIDNLSSHRLDIYCRFQSGSSVIRLSFNLINGEIDLE